MIPVAAAIDRLAGGTYPVTRRAMGSYVDGRYVPGTASVLSIKALIQPAGHLEVMRLPEGERDRKTIAIYTRTPLVHAVANGPPSDRIAWRGDIFEISSIDEWNEYAGFTYALATKIQDLTDSGSLESPLEGGVVG